MKILVLQFKGGVAKTSIATSLALSQGFDMITNDLVTTMKNLKSVRCHFLDQKLKTIPSKLLPKNKDIVMDMGAMSGSIDPKIIKAIELADAIIIPTLTDQRSVQGAIQTIKFANGTCSNLFIIVNRVKKEAEYNQVVTMLSPYIHSESIYCMKETTLFKRIAYDGDGWYHNIHNTKGSFQLQKTISKHNIIYDDIINFTKQITAIKER